MLMVATAKDLSASGQAPSSITGLYAHFIGGRRVLADGPPDLVRTNPSASAEVLGGMRSADIELVKSTVRTAAEAWPTWRNTAAPSRGKVLLEAARLMDTHREELARLISLEEGKALKDSRAEVQRSINITEFMSGEGRRFGGYTSGSESLDEVCLHHAATAGGGGVHHALEFPARDSRVEDRAGADRRATRSS